METQQDNNTTRSDRATKVNELTLEEINSIVEFMKKNVISQSGLYYIEPSDRGFHKCNLKPTKTAKGEPKYPQIDLNRFKKGLGKQLAHLIWWRYENRGALINSDLTISHCDANHQLLHLVQESRDANESRKYCHLFKWYKTKEGEDKPRCPHWEHPCTGP